MHSAGRGKSRLQRVKQSMNREPSVLDYENYIPIGSAVKKPKSWKIQGASIIYLSSHEKIPDVRKDKAVLKKYGFPSGRTVFRKKGIDYKDIAERIMPDILIEDDCESIGGTEEMTITKVKPSIKKRIKSIVVKEFAGIDRLPDDVNKLHRTA
ncbi:MAG: hypothetical protein HY517_02875 [Candidatus Aenigmarchaeota archaeon]|nr:hypothetical protein [Candidatus Aenigmarchaeota archaeon]